MYPEKIGAFIGIYAPIRKIHAPILVRKGICHGKNHQTSITHAGKKCETAGKDLQAF